MTISIIFCISLLVVYSVIIFNGLIAVKHNINKAWANIDVLLKQRHDELTKLIEVCKGYMKYEQELLSNLTALRVKCIESSHVSDIAKVESSMTNAMKTLFAVAEKYPDLKANTNFLYLQKRISALESQIADRREIYNDFVNIFNIRIQQFPDMILANWMNYVPQDMFKVSSQDRNDIDASAFLFKNS